MSEPMSLRKRIQTAASWSLLGIICGNLIRLASNVILTRLLFPESFGTMLIANTIILGINLASDLGIQTIIVKQRDLITETEINTLWTLQVLRGVALATALTCIAGPAGTFYANNKLPPILHLLSISTIISAFNSTKPYIADRNLDLKRQTISAVLSQLISGLTMVVFAYLTHETTALAFGNIASAVFACIYSHIGFKGLGNKFSWSHQYALTSVKFGTFMIASSGFTFMAGEGKNLALGKYLDSTQLGVVGIASGLSFAIWQLVQSVASKVLLPAYSELNRTRPTDWTKKIIKGRNVVLGTGVISCLILNVGSEFIISTLYDSRYKFASTIMSWQCTGLAITLLSSSYSGVLWALDKPKAATLLIAVEAFAMLTPIMLVGNLGNPSLVIFITCVSGLILYPFTAWQYRTLSLWQPKVDLPILTVAAAYLLHLYQSIS